MLEQAEDIKKIVKIKKYSQITQESEIRKFNSENYSNQDKKQGVNFFSFFPCLQIIKLWQKPSRYQGTLFFTHSLQELFLMLYHGTVQQ